MLRICVGVGDGSRTARLMPAITCGQASVGPAQVVFTGDLLSTEPQASDPTDRSIRLDWRFIHPVDLLIHRLTRLFREADGAIYAAQMYAAGRAVSGAQRGYCSLAEKAVSSARLAAYDINRWLDRGMGPNAGTFESDLRKLLRQYESDLDGLPESATYEPILERLRHSQESIDDSIRDLEETARDHGGEAESIWNEHLLQLPKRFNATYRGLQELVSNACDPSSALSDQPDQVRMLIDQLEKTLTPICAQVMFLIEDADLEVPSLNTLCKDYRYCVSDILQAQRLLHSNSRRAFETSDELVHIFDQFPPDALLKNGTPCSAVVELTADQAGRTVPRTAEEAIKIIKSPWATYDQIAPVYGLTPSALRGKVKRDRDNKKDLKQKIILDEDVRPLVDGGLRNPKMQFRVASVHRLLQSKRSGIPAERSQEKLE